MSDWKDERRKWAEKYNNGHIEFLLHDGLLPEHVHVYNDEVIDSSDTCDYKRENFGRLLVIGWDGQVKRICDLTPEELDDWKQQVNNYDFDTALRNFQESVSKYPIKYGKNKGR